MHAVADDNDAMTMTQIRRKQAHKEKKYLLGAISVDLRNKDYARTHKIHAVGDNNDDDEKMDTLPCRNSNDYIAKLPCVKPFVPYTKSQKKLP